MFDRSEDNWINVAGMKVGHQKRSFKGFSTYAAKDELAADDSDEFALASPRAVLGLASRLLLW